MSRALFDKLLSLLSRPFDEGNEDGELLKFLIWTLGDNSNDTKEATWRCMTEAVHSVPEDIRRPWLSSIAMDLFPLLINESLTMACPPEAILPLLRELAAASVPREALTFLMEGLSTCCHHSEAAPALLVITLISLLLKALLSISSTKQRVKNALVSLPSVARAASHLSLNLRGSASQDDALTLCEPFIEIISELRTKVFSEINDVQQLCLLALHIASCFFWLVDCAILRRGEMIRLIQGILKDGFQIEQSGCLEHWLMLIEDVDKVSNDDKGSLLVPDNEVRAGIALLALLSSNPNEKPTAESRIRERLTRIEILSRGLSLSRSLIVQAELRQSHMILAKSVDLIGRLGRVATQYSGEDEEDDVLKGEILETSRVLAINVVVCSTDLSLGKGSYSSLLSLLSGISPNQRLRVLHYLSGWPRDASCSPPPMVVSLALSILQHQIMKALTAPSLPYDEPFTSSIALGPIPHIISCFVTKASPYEEAGEGEGEVLLASLSLLRSICLYFNSHGAQEEVLGRVARKLLEEAATFIHQAKLERSELNNEESDVLLSRLKLAVEI